MKRHTRRLCLVLFVVAVLAASPPVSVTVAQESSGQESSRVMSARDTLRISSVGSAAISPDDRWVLYTRTERDMDDEMLESSTHIWRVGLDGVGRRQLTRGDSSAGSPEWFPQGDRFAFVTSRDSEDGDDGDRQVWAIYSDGGEAWQLTDHEGGIGQFDISPDGTMVLFTARDPLTEEEEEEERLHDDAEVVDQDFRMTHLWVHDVESGDERRLTEGEFTVSDPRWSPDSARIAYVTRPTPRVDDGSWSDIHVVDVESGESRLLYENAGPDSSPRWSPDGSTIAYSSNPHEGTTTWYDRLHLIPAQGGDPLVLLEDFDLDFGVPIWSEDGASIFWSTGEGTTISLFEIDPESGEIDRAPIPTGANFGWTLSDSGDHWVWSHSNPGWPGELYTVPADFSSEPVRLTDANPWIRDESLEFGEVETIRWTNSDGQSIEGVMTYPVDYQEGQAYPLVVNPHGGPSGARIESFSSSNQFFAGNGFLVLQPNFRGSSNYGQEFLNANRDNWGIRDYDDIMTGVDHVIAEGLADPDRMVAYGWSYGGYMTFWMSTQTDRFEVISPGAGLSNLYSMYSTTDIPAYLAWFFGTPWENEDIYRRLSPIRHAQNVSSKILIMHGAEDERVPPEQAVEFYKALTDLGKDVTFVRYPRQGHGIGEPRLAMDRLRRYLYTFAEAVGIEPISEREWEREQKEKQEKRGGAGPGAGSAAVARSGGIIDVALPPSEFDVSLIERLDPGTFQVIERGRPGR